MAAGFLLVGPSSFLANHLKSSVVLVQGSAALLGSGCATVVVSSFGRSQRAALQSGFHDDLDTYVFVAGTCDDVTVFVTGTNDDVISFEKRSRLAVSNLGYVISLKCFQV